MEFDRDIDHAKGILAEIVIDQIDVCNNDKCVEPKFIVRSLIQKGHGLKDQKMDKSCA